MSALMLLSRPATKSSIQPTAKREVLGAGENQLVREYSLLGKATPTRMLTTKGIKIATDVK
jgi:hypothetical protein